MLSTGNAGFSLHSSSTWDYTATMTDLLKGSSFHSEVAYKFTTGLDTEHPFSLGTIQGSSSSSSLSNGISSQGAPISRWERLTMADDNSTGAWTGTLRWGVNNVSDMYVNNLTNLTNSMGHDPVVKGLSLNYPLPAMIIVGVMLFLLTIATAFGNFLVGLALYKFRNLRTVSNYLIGNLALSDFFLAVTILPFSSVNEMLGYWIFGEIMCNLWLLLDVLYCTASIWNLCIIALDRFTATLYPLWYREKRSTKQAGIYIAVVWIVSIAICMPPLFGWNDLKQNYKFDNDTNVYQCFPFQTPSYVLYSASGSFFVPFVITVFLYVRIFMVLHVRMKKMRKARQRRTQASANSKPKTTLYISTPKVADKTEQTIELNQVGKASANSGHTEEQDLSSRSLVPSCGESSGASENKSDLEEEESSAQARSDNPLYVSSSDMEGPPRALKNGVNRLGKDAKESELMVIMNPTHTFTDSEKESDKENMGLTSAVEGDTNNTVNHNQNHKDGPRLLKVVTIANQKAVQDSKDQKATLSPPSPSENHHRFGLAIRNANPFKRHTKHAAQKRSSQKRRVDQREVRATVRMAVIIAFFCGCWIGFFVSYVVHSWCTSCFIPRELDAFFFWLGYSNSSMNPILYAIFNEEFRTAFQKLLGCHMRRGRGSSAFTTRSIGKSLFTSQT